MITDFTYTQAKEIIKTIGRFKIQYYKSKYLTREEPMTHYNLTIIKPTKGEKYEEYAIGTEDEADLAWEEALESYWDECIESEIPSLLRNYMDYEKWKSDAKMDGRGHALSFYDGDETDVADLVMFRIN